MLLPDGVAVHVAFVAAERAGFTIVGLGHRAGDAEIRHILGKTGAQGIVTLAEHRGRPTAELVDALRADGLPVAHHVVVAADASGDITVNGDAASDAPFDLGRRAYGADDLFIINSTSGTTGMPKCVLHNQNRWFFFHQLAAAAGEMTGDDVFFGAVPAPFGFGLWTAHVTPNILGSDHRRDGAVRRRRSAASHRTRARDRALVREHAVPDDAQLTRGRAARPHVTALHVHRRAKRCPYERAARFEDVTGARVLQFYGSNETGALSNTTMRDDREHRLQTAGRIIPEMNVRLLDDDGRDITEPGVAGNPVCKGAATCFGYLDDDAANEELITDDGFMRIGDLCEIDADGYLRVVGPHLRHHHPRRQEHQRARRRSRGGEPPRDRGRGRGVDARRDLRRAGVPLRRVAAGIDARARRRGRAPPRARRLTRVVPRAPCRGRRAPARVGRQGARRVSCAPTSAGASSAEG